MRTVRLSARLVFAFAFASAPNYSDAEQLVPAAPQSQLWHFDAGG
jgi:hypothetical protein